MAIIRLNTEPASVQAEPLGAVGMPAEVTPVLPEGVPLDFEFYARRTYAGRPLKQALKQALADFQESVSGPRSEAVVGTESVVVRNLLTHPSLYANQASIDERERIPRDWLPLVSQKRALIESTLASVGRIQVHHFAPEGMFPRGYEVGIVIGTGFVVARNIVMTNRHVAAKFALAKSSKRFVFRQDPRSGRDPVVMIDFGGTYDEQPDVHRIKSILYMAPESRWDVALLELQSTDGREVPPPIALQTVDPGVQEWPIRAFVCGYPTTLPNDQDLANLFQMFRVKRVSLGEVLGETPYDSLPRIVHNCTTLPGSSGSPLVDFGTGTVWGLHFFGYPGTVEGNRAEPMWDVCSLGPVRDTLGTLAQQAVPTVTKSFGGVKGLPSSRPVIFVARGDIAPHERFPNEWFQPESEEHQLVRTALQAVGLVRVEDSETPPRVGAGTGFVVAPGVFLTTFFRARTQNTSKSKRSKPRLYVEFAASAGEEPSVVEEVRDILLEFEVDMLPYALLKLNSRTAPKPLTLQKTNPTRSPVGEDVFIVGHPFLDDQRNDPNHFARVFPPPYGVKRLALGSIIRGPGQARAGLKNSLGTDLLYHDCSTAGGDGGSPLISLSSGRVLGVHVGGQYLERNYAATLWSFLANRKVRAFVK